MNATRKLVVSETLAALGWQNAALIEEPIAEELPELKRAHGGEAGVFGSITLVQSLLRRGLIDELRLLVHPVTVGRGRRLVEGALAETQPQLLEASALSSGVLDLAYAPPQRDLPGLASRERGDPVDCTPASQSEITRRSSPARSCSPDRAARQPAPGCSRRTGRRGGRPRC